MGPRGAEVPLKGSMKIVSANLPRWVPSMPFVCQYGSLLQPYRRAQAHVIRSGAVVPQGAGHKRRVAASRAPVAIQWRVHGCRQQAEPLADLHAAAVCDLRSARHAVMLLHACVKTRSLQQLKESCMTAGAGLPMWRCCMSLPCRCHRAEMCPRYPHPLSQEPPRCQWAGVAQRHPPRPLQPLLPRSCSALA